MGVRLNPDRSSSTPGTGSLRAGPFAEPIVSLLLMATGLVLVGLWGGQLGPALWSVHADEGRWRQAVAAVPPVPHVAGAPRPPADLARPVDGMDFWISVPKLGYSALVHEGVGLNVLALGPGHYPGSPWPGQPGNVGVAAHNVFWIRFNDLEPADEINLETRYGRFRYWMTGSTIVSPDDHDVLDPVPGRRLTLTTCWPLWAGQFANRRLVISATDRPPA